MMDSGQTDILNGRLWISEAVASRGFSVPYSDEPPAAELDGEPIDVRALIYAVMVELGNGSPFTLPDDISQDDYARAVLVVREVKG